MALEYTRRVVPYLLLSSFCCAMASYKILVKLSTLNIFMITIKNIDSSQKIKSIIFTLLNYIFLSFSR